MRKAYNNEETIIRTIDLLSKFNFSFFVIKNKQLLQMEKNNLVKNLIQSTEDIFCKKL